ncbi:MAG TPA: CopD family protein [Steroidobacteraceae bacterium]|nr:CopD family protein [Steroidobacteraceae bacterium]
MLDLLAALAQFTLYGGVLSAVGGVLAAATLRAPAASRGALERLVRTGATFTIAATLAGALVLLYRLGGNFDEQTISAVLMSSVGAAGGLQIVGALLLLLTPASSDDTFVAGMRLSYAGLIAASFLFNGHSAAVGMPLGLVACAHISLGAWWLGSLIAMERACALSPVQETAAVVQRFSALAVGAIVALIVAGIIMVIALIARPISITPYLQVLLVKIGIAVAVFGLASYNKFRLTPRLLAHDPQAALALQRAIHIELFLIGAVLVTTAILTTYQSPEG